MLEYWFLPSVRQLRLSGARALNSTYVALTVRPVRRPEGSARPSTTSNRNAHLNLGHIISGTVYFGQEHSIFFILIFILK